MPPLRSNSPKLASFSTGHGRIFVWLLESVTFALWLLQLLPRTEKRVKTTIHSGLVPPPSKQRRPCGYCGFFFLRCQIQMDAISISQHAGQAENRGSAFLTLFFPRRSRPPAFFNYADSAAFSFLRYIPEKDGRYNVHLANRGEARP